MPKRMPVTTRNMLSVEFNRLYVNGATWREIATAKSVSVGVIYRMANSDYEPKKPAIRKALGLPVYAPAQVCAVHGVVHVTKRCPSDQPRKPRKKYPRWFSGNYKGKFSG